MAVGEAQGATVGETVGEAVGESVRQAQQLKPATVLASFFVLQFLARSFSTQEQSLEG